MNSANAEFIGPFTDGSALKTALRLLRRIFPYCTCRQLHNNYCLNYHIGKCLGDCCLKIQNVKINSDSRLRTGTFDEQNQNDNVKLKNYKKNIKAIKEILSGKRSSLINRLEKEMKKLGEKSKFEEALELQYKIEKLKRVFQNAQIIQNTKYLPTGQAGKILDTETAKNSPSLLKQLAKTVGMTRLPRRIEAYDIANIQGQHAVGAMVVFTNGIPDKNEYRKFKIHTKHTPDDTAMLKEVLKRRFNHPEWPFPDLILVDGGRGQLNAAISTLSESRIKNLESRIKLIALTKNEKHIGHKIILGNKKEILLSTLPINIKNFLLQIDSEAHRFAISYYRKIHRESLK